MKHQVLLAIQVKLDHYFSDAKGHYGEIPASMEQQDAD